MYYSKVLSLATCLLGLGLATNAEVTINFNTGTSSVKTILDHNSAALGTGQLFLVFWSSDQSVSGFNSSNPLSPTGGDVLLTPSGMNTTAGAGFTGAITGHSGDIFGAGTSSYSPGYLYIAVFEMSYASFSGSIAANTYYGLGPISNSLTQDFGVTPRPTADAYGALITSGSPLVTSSQVVPEPSTVMLMVAGLGIIGLRAVRKK